MIQYSYTGNSELIKSAVREAQRLLSSAVFLSRIEEHSEFFDDPEQPSGKSNVNGAIVSAIIRDADLVMTIKYYRSKNPWSWAVAYVNPAQPSTLYLNTRKFEAGTIAGYTNTLIHETIHALDSQNTVYHFGHGENDSDGKENTAPYWIGCLAERYLTGDNSACTYPLGENKEDVAAVFEPSDIA